MLLHLTVSGKYISLSYPEIFTDLYFSGNPEFLELLLHHLTLCHLWIKRNQVPCLSGPFPTKIPALHFLFKTTGYIALIKTLKKYLNVNLVIANTLFKLFYRFSGCFMF